MIFITGCARSGTSLTTQILQAHGCNLGKGRINGLYENVEVREKVLKRILESLGYDQLGQKPLPPEDCFFVLNGGEVQNLVNAKEPWAYKDAKLSLIWRGWNTGFPEAKWVLVRRDKEKIVDSCMRTSFMRAFDDRAGWERWVDEHEKRFEGMRHCLDMIEVWPSHFIEDAEAFRPVAEFCGLEFDRAKVEAAIDRTAYH